MKTTSYIIGSLLALGGMFLGIFANANQSLAQRIDPIVSTDWLASHSSLVKIIDIRNPDDFKKGHIPGAINEPFIKAFDPKCQGPSSNWIVGSEDCLWLQLPKNEDLFKTIGNLGITKDSLIVIITAPTPNQPPYFGFANATRVATTLIYAGVKNVAILDGGYLKWVSEGKPISTEIPNVIPITYRGDISNEIFVTIDYVEKNINKAVIIDARDTEVYFGVVTEPYAPKPGHIPQARSLPAPWIWKFNKEGIYTYKDKEILRAMASGVINRDGKSKDKEIIIYCGVGGYASSWWFVLTQILKYENVKIFDGSAQEWVKKGYNMVSYKWE